MFWQGAEHFDEAHDGELADVLDQLDARSAHLIAADADELERRPSRRKLARDDRAVQVAGNFTGDEEDLTHDWRPRRGAQPMSAANVRCLARWSTPRQVLPDRLRP